MQADAVDPAKFCEGPGEAGGIVCANLFCCSRNPVYPTLKLWDETLGGYPDLSTLNQFAENLVTTFLNTRVFILQDTFRTGKFEQGLRVFFAQVRKKNLQQVLGHRNNAISIHVHS